MCELIESSVSGALCVSLEGAAGGALIYLLLCLINVLMLMRCIYFKKENIYIFSTSPGKSLRVHSCATVSIWIVEPKQTEIEMFYDSIREKSTFHFWTILMSSVGWFWGQTIVLLLTKGTSWDRKGFLIRPSQICLGLAHSNKTEHKIHYSVSPAAFNNLFLVVSLALKW